MWILAGCVILVLAVVSKGFRRILAVGAVLIIIGGVAVSYLIKRDDETKAQELIVSKSLIPASEVDLVDLRLKLDPNYATLTGRIRNRDQRFTVSGVDLRIKITDCDTPNQCDIVGNTVVSAFAPDGVPPNEARDFSAGEFIDALQPVSPPRSRTWTYQIEDIYAR